MKRPEPERRRNRSNECKRAIELQLEASAARGSFESMVLADELGLVVAAVGDRDETEYLAAVSPRLMDGKDLWQGKVQTVEHNLEVSVAKLDVEYGSFYLAAIGDWETKTVQGLDDTSRGICRIIN